MARTIHLTIDGREYVAVPLAEYRRLTEADGPLAEVDAVAWTRREIAGDLRAAREAAGLSQGELAAKLGRSQTLVSRAESGGVAIGARYVEAVLKACKLPKDWTRPAPAARERGASAPPAVPREPRTSRASTPRTKATARRAS